MEGWPDQFKLCADENSRGREGLLAGVGGATEGPSWSGGGAFWRKEGDLGGFEGGVAADELERLAARSFPVSLATEVSGARRSELGGGGGRGELDSSA